MSDQDVTHPSIPVVWHDRIRRGLKPESDHFPQGLFVSKIEYNVPLQWRVISITEGSHFSSPPGIYVETNFTQQLLDLNPNFVVHMMSSAITLLLMGECEDKQSIPVPEHIRKKYQVSERSRISLGNGVEFHPYKMTTLGTVVLEVRAPSLVESMNAVRSLEPKPRPKFRFTDLFRKK